jgi:hypothetical protein
MNIAYVIYGWRIGRTSTVGYFDPGNNRLKAFEAARVRDR